MFIYLTELRALFQMRHLLGLIRQLLQIIGIKVFIGLLSLFIDLDKATWDDTLVEGLNLVANHVLQVPLFLMTLMRYITPTLDNM